MPLTSPCLGLLKMSSAALSQIHQESSEREMGDRSWLLHRDKLGDKEENRKTGDRGTLWTSGSLGLCGNMGTGMSCSLRLLLPTGSEKKKILAPGLHLCLVLEIPDRPDRPKGSVSIGWKGKTSRAKWAAGLTLTSQHKGLDAGIEHLLPPLLQPPSCPFPSSYPACPTHTCLKDSLVQQSGVCSAPEELFGCPLLALRPETVVSILRL